MHKQLIFIDDSGDPGFNKKASSEIFLMAAVVFDDSKDASLANERIAAIRRHLHWRPNREFKFRKVDKKTKMYFLQEIYFCNFSIYAVYVNKLDYPAMFRFHKKEPLYTWSIKELIKTIHLNQAQIVIDGECGRNHKLHLSSFLRKGVGTEGRNIRNIKVRDSRSDNLIQLADMVAGAINRSFQTDKTDSDSYIGIIQKKIKNIKKLKL